jgi:hypothetical protein
LRGRRSLSAGSRLKCTYFAQHRTPYGHYDYRRLQAAGNEMLARVLEERMK